MGRSNAVDDIFTPAGLAVALVRGCELNVEVAPHRSVTISESDLSCPECDGPIEPPTRKPAFFLALNKVANDGLCAGCDAATP